MSVPLQIPKIVKILQEKGEISDELDYALMNYLLQHVGPGYTACKPQLVELEDGKQAIKMGIDNTFIGKGNKIMGMGIVGTILISLPEQDVLYCTSVAELEANVEKMIQAGIEPQVRPRGKY
ncbi:MAG: hypothetical protein ACFFBP_19310 [Promethearchaeota archaeon]